MIKQAFAVLGALALGGCYSMQGSERILDRDGYITGEVPAISVFRYDFEDAFTDRLENPDVDQGKVDAMLSSGFTHIYSYCDNYFDVMGLKQRRSRIGRDAISPLSALITGVLAMHNFENDPGDKEDLLAALGLATAATTSVLDIYDEHLLFGAENVGAVETLTLNALNEHSTTVMRFTDVTYDSAIRHLLKNQSMCSPQHILQMTREAIREGNPTASGPQGGGGGDRPGVVGNEGVVNNGGDDTSDRPVEVTIENR